MSLRTFALLGALALAGCDEHTNVVNADGDVEPRVDAGHDGRASPDVDGAPGEDAEGLLDVEVVGGPLTYIVNDLEMLSDRVCDLDGDGVDDNAVADLGSPSSELFRLMVNAIIDDSFGAQAGFRYLLHSPWVSDLNRGTEPDLCIFPVVGIDTDEPVDPTDDDSGEEVFWRGLGHLDDCGEPLYATTDASVERGVGAGRAEALPISFMSYSFLLEDALFDGTIDTVEGTLDLRSCGIARFPELARIANVTTAGDLNLLEMLLAGGAVLGAPTAPGLEPDLDLDGDGLERFVLDDLGHIVECIDGDNTSILGRGCYEDERMADGISMNLRILGVRAVLGDFHPENVAYIEAYCPDPPDETAWDGC